LCCLKERQRPKKRNMINHFITGCVPQGMTIAKQHNGWGSICWGAFVVHKSLLWGC